MNKIVKNALILTIISLICGISLGAVYEITKAPIAQAEADKKQAAYQAVIPEGETFEVLDLDAQEAMELLENNGIDKTTIDEAVCAKAGEETAGYIITVTNGEGYGGSLQMTVGLTPDGIVSGISFLSISESPGLGMEARDNEDWAPQYNGKEVDSYTVIKGDASSDEEISAISGATITSKAVTKGVNAAKLYYREMLMGGGEN